MDEHADERSNVIFWRNRVPGVNCGKEAVITGLTRIVPVISMLGSTLFFLGCEAEKIVGNAGYPKCEIISPENGERVKGIVEIRVEATDDKGVVRVDFHLDGSDFPSSSDYLAPFVWEWNTEYYPDMSDHTIFARAYDTDDQMTGSELVTVTIDRAFGPPDTSQILTILSYDPSSLTLSWEQNRDSDFESYDLYRGTMPGVDVEGTPHHREFDQRTTTFVDSNLTTGQTYYYRLVVIDTDGYRSVSDERWGVPTTTPFGQHHFFAYSEQSDYGYQNYGVFRYDLDTDSQSKILDEGYYGTVSKDGKWLYYRVYSYSSDIRRYNFETGETERVTFEPHTHIYPRISDDQTRYCYYASPPVRAVYVADIDGSNQRLLRSLYGFTNFVFRRNDRVMNRGIVYDTEGNPVGTLIDYDEENWGVFKSEYSSNGDQLVVIVQSPPFERFGSPREETRVLLYSVAGEEIAQILPESFGIVHDVDFVNTNSGEKVLVLKRYEIGIIDKDGSNYRVLKSVSETSGRKLAHISSAK